MASLRPCGAVGGPAVPLIASLDCDCTSGSGDGTAIGKSRPIDRHASSMKKRPAMQAATMEFIVVATLMARSPEARHLLWPVALSGLVLSLLTSGLSQPARAQRVIPKIQNLCPMGYVDTFNGKCSTLGLMNYTVAPTEGRPCQEGWMNIGGGYCRRK